MHSDQRTSSNFLFNVGEGQFEHYFRQLDRAVTTYASWLATTTHVLDASLASDYVRVLREAYNALHFRHFYDENDGLTVDFDGSGYPHGYTASQLRADKARAEHVLAGTPKLDLLKRAALDDLFKTGSFNRSVLHRIGQRYYFESVSAPWVDSFSYLRGKVLKFSDELLSVSWAAFDQQHQVPAIFSMTFKTSAELDEVFQRSLDQVLRFESNATMSVSLLASNIDQAMPSMTPVSLNRVILGPIYFPGITRQSSPWLTLLNDHGTPDDFLITAMVDITHSVDVIHPSKLAVSFGVEHAERQVYAIDPKTPLHYERGAYRVEAVAILPHGLLQAVEQSNDSQTAWLDEHQVTTFNTKGEIQ